MAQWMVPHIPNQENLSAPHCSSSLCCIIEYVAIDSGEYLCVNSLHSLIAVKSI